MRSVLPSIVFSNAVKDTMGSRFGNEGLKGLITSIFGSYLTFDHVGLSAYHSPFFTSAGVVRALVTISDVGHSNL